MNVCTIYGITVLFCMITALDANSRTGYAYDNRFTHYFQNTSESQQRVSAIDSALFASGIKSQCVQIEPLDNPRDYILRVHTKEHVEGIEAIPVHGDSSKHATERVGAIAELAVGYALGAVRDVCSGKITNAFCNIRPPGHHAVNAGQLSAYCAYANVVIAARYAQDVFKISRVLIIDWDCHKGNGTVNFICADTSILFLETGVNTFQYAACNSVNRHVVSLDVGPEYGNDDFFRVWNDQFFTLADSFKPELVLLSCGFDLKRGDPECGMLKATAYGISKMTRFAMDIAEKHCGGKLVSLLEGGYVDRYGDTTYQALAQCAQNHVGTLLTGNVQPETEFFESTGVKFRGVHSLVNLYGPGTVPIAFYNLAGKRIVGSGAPGTGSVVIFEMIDKKGIRYFTPQVMK